jgi:hypothetical protein
MAIIGENEVAVDDQMRHGDKQNQSQLDRMLEGAESATNVFSFVTDSAPLRS